MDTALLHAPDAVILDDTTADPVARVVAALEEDIVLGVLNPRERLIEDDLMHRFGIKRHVVREVLAMLDRLGLTERRRNIGSLVRSFTPKEVSELYQLRALLETQAASLIPQSPDPDALNELIEIQEAHDAAVQANDPRRVFRANVRFHQALFGLTGNVVLQRAIAEYARQTHPIRFSSATRRVEMARGKPCRFFAGMRPRSVAPAIRTASG